MGASKECVTCEMRSLGVCCLCTVYIVTLRPRLGKWHCFLQGKTRYRFGFVSVGFLSYFYPPKAKFLIGKVAFQASSCVRSMNVLFSAVNDPSTCNQLPQADFMFQSFLTSARVHSWT